MEGKVSLHLIEISPKMRELQCNTLCPPGETVNLDESTSETKHKNIPVSWHNSIGEAYLSDHYRFGDVIAPCTFFGSIYNAELCPVESSS